MYDYPISRSFVKLRERWETVKTAAISDATARKRRQGETLRAVNEDRARF
jgi:hypothetical protein